MGYLAVDYGLKKTGLAISEGFIAAPYETISSRNIEEKIAQIVKKLAITKIVIGIPEGQFAKQVEHLAKDLKQKVSVDIVFYNEDLTSKKAIQAMIDCGKSKKSRKRDQHQVAASIILQSYLDYGREK